MKQPSLRDLLDDEALLDRLSRREDPGGDQLGVLLAAVVARADAPLSPGPRQSPRRRRFVAAMGLAVAISGAGMAAAMTIPSMAPSPPATVQPSVATPSSPAPAGKAAPARQPASSGAGVATDGTAADTRGVPTSGHAAGAATPAGSATALPLIDIGGSTVARSEKPTGRADAVGSANPTPVAAPRTAPGTRPAPDAKTRDATTRDAKTRDAKTRDAKTRDATTPDPANPESDDTASNKGSAGVAATAGQTDRRSAAVPSQPAVRPERTAVGSRPTSKAVSPATTSLRASPKVEPARAGVPGANADPVAQPAITPEQRRAGASSR